VLLAGVAARARQHRSAGGGRRPRGRLRVLRPGGRLLFLEHGAAPDAGVRRTQDRLDRVWGCFAGGCHLSRDPLLLIRRAGFEIVEADAGYARGAPRFAAFLSSGVANA